MKKRNTSNNPLFRKIRELEEKALEAGIIEKAQIKTSEAMREEAWECYLVSRMEWLESMIKDKELEA
ncbi:MAG: hypothetical protein PUD00_04895 [Treponema berlinense]|uniref:hypothetical protein n=1 Tax=Treponema berlinense TaxID=225004 RepID=UPI0023F358AE|nr:hypothetical protein [Treponema berlinense]MDD5834550.1 hypothetical protein [Treponema berlinense]